MANLSALKRFKLDEVFWFQEGPGVRKWQFTDSGIKLLNVANIEKNRTINLGKTDRHLDFKEVEDRYSHFLLDAGDLVIASSGISFDDDGMLRTRGAFVEERHLPLCLNTSTIRFKSKPEISDLGYLQHWLDSREFREQITKRVTGSAQQNFGPSHLKEIKITLPPLPEQRRIAAILDQADALRAKRREALAQLDSLTQSIFVEMFGDPVTNPKGWRLGNVQDALNLGFLKEIQDGNHGELHPKVSDFSDVGIPFIMANCLSNGLLSLDEAYRLEPFWLNKLRIGFGKPNDLLLSHKGTVGEVAIVPDDCESVILSPQVTYYRLGEQFNPKFLAGYFKTSWFQAVLKKEAIQSTRAYIGITRQRLLPLIFPPFALQQEFALRIDLIEKLKEDYRNALTELDVLFASLQHRAFRGEL